MALEIPRLSRREGAGRENQKWYRGILATEDGL
jgi:hypothetical protein